MTDQERPIFAPTLVPFKRCKAKLPPYTSGAGPFYGRCELLIGHDGDHILERGLDLIKFKIEVIG